MRSIRDEPSSSSSVILRSRCVSSSEIRQNPESWRWEWRQRGLKRPISPHALTPTDDAATLPSH
jgi:hypothetical protein